MWYNNNADKAIKRVSNIFLAILNGWKNIENSIFSLKERLQAENPME